MMTPLMRRRAYWAAVRSVRERIARQDPQPGDGFAALIACRVASRGEHFPADMVRRKVEAYEARYGKAPGMRESRRSHWKPYRRLVDQFIDTDRIDREAATAALIAAWSNDRND